MGHLCLKLIVFAKYECFLQIFASAKSGIGLHHGKCRCLLRNPPGTLTGVAGQNDAGRLAVCSEIGGVECLEH